MEQYTKKLVSSPVYTTSFANLSFTAVKKAWLIYLLIQA